VPGCDAYVASKHGVLGLTKTTVIEYGKDGLRINAVCPGVIQTEMADRIESQRPGIFEPRTKSVGAALLTLTSAVPSPGKSIDAGAGNCSRIPLCG